MFEVLVLASAAVMVPDFDVSQTFPPPPMTLAPPGFVRGELLNFPRVIGNGTLELDLNEVFDPGNKLDKDNAHTELWLLFNKNGNIVLCYNRGLWFPAVFEKVCNHIKKSGRYRFNPSFTLPVEAAGTSINISFGPAPNLDPQIQFVGRGKGLKVEANLSLSAKGTISLCDIAFLGIVLSKDEEKRICAALETDAVQAKLKGKMKRDESLNRVAFWLKQNAEKTERHRFVWSEYVDTSFDPYVYRSTTPKTAQRVDHSQGSFSASISEDDYPEAASKLDVTGFSTVDLGIDEQGVVKSCTPVKSSGFLILDLKSCEVLQRTGKCRFNPSGSFAKGLHYHRQTIRWNKPK